MIFVIKRNYAGRSQLFCVTMVHKINLDLERVRRMRREAGERIGEREREREREQRYRFRHTCMIKYVQTIHMYNNILTTNY